MSITDQFDYRPVRDRPATNQLSGYRPTGDRLTPNQLFDYRPVTDHYIACMHAYYGYYGYYGYYCLPGWLVGCLDSWPVIGRLAA